MLTCGNEDILLEFGPNNSVEKEKKKREKEREGEGRRSIERNSTFSLDFPMIGSSVSGKARGKVLPCDKSYK